jgi:ornithine cyclodeaminase/alanine dehydrogenase-like protein (mu-crystallin family)
MSTVLRLRIHELPEALAGSDVPRAVVDELLWQEVADNSPTLSARRVGGWRMRPGVGEDLTLLYGDRSQSGLLLPASGLAAVRGAALTAAAARMFVAPQVVTVSVLGAGLAARLQVTALAAHVPGVSHVALHSPGRVPAALVEQLDGAGIGLTVTECGADAVFGANLVVLAGPQATTDWQFPHGAVVVNATGHALPDGVQADQLFVDDRRLITRNCPVVADLGQVLAGRHPGRTADDDVLLVDLLGVDTGGLWLTHQLYQAALRHGLGVPADALPETDGYQGGMWP